MQQKQNIERLNDTWLRIVGIPAIAIISGVAFYSDERAMYHISLMKVILTGLAISIVGWEVNRRILLYFRRKFPEINRTLKRVTFTYLGIFTFNILFFAVLHVYYNYSLYWNHLLTLKEFVINVSVAFFFTSVLGAIYEMVYYFRKWKETIIESETLKKENLQKKLDSLRNQINPHFLFNSLNTLEALTEEKSENSTQFVRELANVYRFILQSQDKKLNSVKDELDFINAYSFLLQTRFGNNLSVKMDVDEDYFDHHIPPLTLQMLVENAMKHNIVSSSKPLQIKITNNRGEALVVANNLQRKNQMVPSNRVGLSNIKKRYEILGIDGVVIEELAGEFRVTVPLILNALE